jgi:tetratricopeptide (TPR) repeat protein
VTVHIPPTPNQHFVIPRQVRTYYTGRESQLAKVEAAFRDPTLPIQQVFVIYGLSGSGKTELAFRFSEEHRHRFWGVFYVDGTSEKHAATSYATIATIGGVAPNEKAAKNWLATRALPWLLIIDNVDEEKIKIHELLPQGAKGCCIITTRNPAHITHGNVGDRYLELLPMEPEEAQTLIIKAAEEPKPWPSLVVDSAKAICYALGFLPLALDQAAKAIRHGICEWAEYLVYFDRQIRRIRRTLHGRSRSRSAGREQNQEDKHSINVFSTYEILYESLQSSPKERYQDAVELLHVFSYFHFQNIRLDVLVNAATNSLKEAEQQRQDETEMKMVLEKLEKVPRTPWNMFFRELRAFVRMKLATPLPLPGVLRNRDRLGLSALEDEVQVRLRQALGVLIERSLVMRQDRATGQYSMHRLVHKWVRERPEMSTSHQALWCQISMTTLALGIRRPPYDDTEDESRARRRELLPHIRHVCEHQKEIENRLEENAARAGRLWSVKKSYGRLEAEQDVRFSRVYGETGHFDKARELQERALGFVSGRLGPDHPIAIGLSLLLSHSLWEMSEMDKASQRQRQARQLCIDTWGENHPLTLDVTDLLGSALYFKGRWSEAIFLHTSNTEKLRRLYGEKNEKTLKSIRNTARLHYRRMNYEEATELYQKSWEGMKEIRGETYLETLFSLEDLAMSYVRYEEDNPDPRREEHLGLSHKYMKFVYEQRKEQLGAEHHYTLLAVLYLARTKSELGMHSEAETMIVDGLKIAERNIPPEHIAFLLAKTIYAQVLTRQKKYAEAESIFHMLVDKAQYRRLVDDEDGDHPDRLSNLWFLSQCLEEQGKFEQALQKCEELRSGLATIGGKGKGMSHKMVLKIQAKIPRLQELIHATSSSNIETTQSPIVKD